MPDYNKLKVKEIADLSDRYRLWKVHLLGEVSINRSTREKMIDVWLVPVADEEKFKDRQSDYDLVHNFTYDFREARVVRIGIGQLILVKIGMFYVDGYPAEIPDYITETFRFTVTENNQKIISPGAYWNKKEYDDPDDDARKIIKTDYYIPARQYQKFLSSDYKSAGLNSFNGMFPSKYLVVDFDPEKQPEVSLGQYPLNQKEWIAERGNVPEAVGRNFGGTQQADEYGGDGDYMNDEQRGKVHGLIIPCVEAARFYYTKSSQSVQAIFFGGLAGTPNKMFDPDRTIKPRPDGSGGFLMLSRYMRNRDRGIIARYAFDPYAMTQAREIHISSINNKMRRGSAVPEAHFPFRDVDTDLKVHGTYLQSGTRIYFFVFWIESCTAPFPFESPHFWRTNPAGRQAPETTEDVTQATSDQTGEVEIREVEKNIDDGQERGQSENIKKSRSADQVEMQSEDAPSEARGKINILLNEKERFPYLKSHPIEARQPKPGSQTERPQQEVEPVFVGGEDQPTETLGTAPRGGGKPVTAASMTPDDLPPDLPELEDNDWQSYYENEIEQPDLSDLLSDDIPNKDENDDGFTKFPVPRRPPKSTLKIPVDLDVFREILGWMSMINPQLELRMINVPTSGEPFTISGATTFPSLLWQRQNGPETPELYIAEMRLDTRDETGSGDTRRYAYLMDIKATVTPQRGFQMFLCFSKKTYGKLKGERLRHILEYCKNNDKTWLEPNMGGKESENEKFPYLARDKFKHDCYSTETYAERLLQKLKNERWMPENY